MSVAEDSNFEVLTDGRLDPASVRILWETPPYADYVWAIRSEIDEDP